MTSARSVEEAAHLDALAALEILDTPVEERFDRITRLAARVLGVKGALINFLDAERQWTKSACGMAVGDVLLSDSLCRHVVAQNAALAVEDLAADQRFASNPFVVGEEGLRFYAGYPLTSHDSGVTVGTLCVVDTKPRSLNDEGQELLAELGRWAEAELNNVAFNKLARLQVQRQQRLETLLRSLPEGVLVVSTNGVVEEANLASRRMFGGDAGVGQSLTLRFRDLPTEMLSTRSRAADHGRRAAATAPVEVSAVRIDGSLFAAEVSWSRLAGDPGSGLMVLVRDLRDVPEAEAEYRRQRRRTEVILSTLAEGVIGVDDAATVLYANIAATRLLRSRSEDLIGRDFFEVLQSWQPSPIEHSAGQLQDVLHDVFRGDQVVTKNQEVRRRDDSSIVVDLTFAPILENREFQGAVVSLVDVSERLAQKQREDEFVAVVSHELRTPLTSIRASLGLLQGQVLGELPTDVLDVLHIAISNTERLTRLVNDLLDMERLTAGAMPMDMTDTHIAELLERVVSSAKPAADAADVRLRTELPADLRCEVDANRIEQAVSNLVANAIKFSRAGGEVRVAASQNGNCLNIVVQDWGRGIPEEKLERIFDRFGQAEVVGDTALGGTGLGLPIARSIVHAHNGHLTVESQLGRGSTFCIRLPLESRGEQS